MWTDNAPGQYCCRQNFLQVASFQERHKPNLRHTCGVSLTHRLAVPDNFKGNHDSVGKDSAIKVRMLEQMGIRSPTAFHVFCNMKYHLERSREKSDWLKWEREGDARIRKKGKYGMDSRTMFYVVENFDEFQKYRNEFPQHASRIILCDRTKFPDTQGKKSIYGSHQLHEVKSLLTAANIPEWPVDNNNPRELLVSISNLPCRCLRCADDSTQAPTCKFVKWRCTREYVMKEKRRVMVPIAEDANPIVVPPNSAPLFQFGSIPAADNTATNDATNESTAATTNLSTNNDSSTNNETTSDEAGEDEGDEYWQINKVYTEAELMSNSPVRCDGDDCNLFACCRWQEMSKQEQEWNTCLDCQKREDDQGFGGWPQNVKEIPISHMSQNHRVLMATHCSTDTDYRNHGFPPSMLFVVGNRRRHNGSM